MVLIFSGIILGSLYAMVSVGLSIVYGILKIYNFAHGSLIMLGAYATLVLFQYTNNMGISIILAIIIAFGIGMLLEKILIEPFLETDNPGLVVVITTLAGMMFLDNTAHLIFGPRIKQLPLLVSGNSIVFGQQFSNQQILLVIITPLILIFLSFFLKYSKVGSAIRAVGQNRGAALLIGINISHIYMITFGIAAAMATLSGIFMGSIRFITPSVGGEYLLKAFIIVLLAGLGNITGTLIAAYLFALMEVLSTFYIGIYWSPAITFLIVILMLILKPEGVFGEY